MKTLPPMALRPLPRVAATERLKELSPSLREVTESLKRRNDTLQLHLTNSGWIINRIKSEKPTAKPKN